MNALQIKFKQTIEDGTTIRRNNGDGLACWKDLKSMFSTDPLEKLKWVTLFIKPNPEFRKSLSELDEKNDDGTMNEPNHYLRQLVNIPIKNPVLCEQRLMQIAYNIGQYKASIEKYSRDINASFTTHEMDSIGYYVEH